MVKSKMVRMYSFKYTARLDWLLFCLEFLYLCWCVRLAWFWFIDLFFSFCVCLTVTGAATWREFPLLCYGQVCGIFDRTYWKSSGPGFTEKILNSLIYSMTKEKFGFSISSSVIFIIFFSESVLVSSKFSNILPPSRW